MRGSPLLHCLIGVIAFALFAVPLVRLTVAREDTIPAHRTAPETTETAGARRTFIRIRFAHVPQSISLKFGGKELVPVATSALPSPIETDASIPLLANSVELVLAARWPDGTPDTAITVELEPDELEARRETRWSSGPALNEILSFKW